MLRRGARYEVNRVLHAGSGRGDRLLHPDRGRGRVVFCPAHRRSCRSRRVADRCPATGRPFGA
jgi:hypothetical protein